MKLNIAICDDNIDFMNKLEKMLVTYSMKSEIDIHADKYPSGHNLLEAYGQENALRYQVIMLDIEMPGENGISIAREIKRNYDFSVLIVFISNYPEYMMDSFSVHPYHFLQKPLTTETLDALMNDIETYYRKTQTLISIISDDSIEHTININEIVYIECIDSASRTLAFHMTDAQIHTTGTLSYWEKTINDKALIPCSRSVIVNLQFIHFIQDNSIVLKTGDIIGVSKRNKKTLVDNFMNKIVSLHDN